MRKYTNEVLEDHGDWLLIDISTPKHQTATMKVDKDVWKNHAGGRVGAVDIGGKYISTQYVEDGKRKQFHRKIIDIPAGTEIDHKSHGSKSHIDNRRTNLRAITHQKNSINRDVQSNNKSGITGVTWATSKNKWQAQIKLNGKNKHLGRFKNKKDAINARRTAEKKYFGEYAYNANNKGV